MTYLSSRYAAINILNENTNATAFIYIIDLQYLKSLCIKTINH